MPNTDQAWMQDSPLTDLEIFVGFSEFKDISGLGINIGTPAPGFTVYNIGAGQASNLFADASAALKRTGMYGSTAFNQQQFGTAAALPGPTTVANTSDPEGIRGYPPYLSSQLPTLRGPQTGPVAKGIQINSVDTIYQTGGVNMTLGQLGVTATNFVNIIAPNVVNLIPLGNNLPLTSQAQIYRFNIPVTSPSFLILPDTEVILNVKITPGSACYFSGCILRCSYNFN